MSDYHDFTDIDTPKKKRIKFNVGDIYINAAKCLQCNDEIRSKNRHDYVTCSCGNVSVDGGSWYVKRVFKTNEYEDNIVPYKDVEQLDEN